MLRNIAKPSLVRIIGKHSNRRQSLLLKTFIFGIRHYGLSLGQFLARYSYIFPLQRFSRTLCTNAAADVLSCWNCNYSYPANIKGQTQFFCPCCSFVQQPQKERTYFDIMDCAPKFDLDTKQLTNNYRKLQSLLHPDKFSLKTKLEIHRQPVEEEMLANDVEFLSTIMEMNEILESGSEKALTNLKNQNKENLEWCLEKVSDAFKSNNLSEAKEILSKMKYYDNINEQIKEKLEW